MAEWRESCVFAGFASWHGRRNISRYSRRENCKCAVFTAGPGTPRIAEESKRFGGGAARRIENASVWLFVCPTSPLHSANVPRVPAGIHKGYKGHKSALDSGSLVCLRCTLSSSIRLQLGAAEESI